MGGSCLLSCQFKIRVLCGTATCYSKKRDLGYIRNKLYYFEKMHNVGALLWSSPPTLRI